MLRVFNSLKSLSALVMAITAMVLLAAASPATAAGRYVEVWNPPEARVAAHAGQPTGKIRAKAARPALLAHGTSKVGTHRVAAPLAKAPAAEKHGVVEAGRKTQNPRSIDIPRILTPEGNVLQVSTGQTSAHVVR